MNIEKTLTTPGERLRRARVLAGLATRREFEKKHHISANTLQGWEQGKNPLSQKGARRVIEAFNREGLICTTEWLLHGIGMPPRPYEMLRVGINEKKTDIDIENLNIKEEKAIYNETQVFKNQYPGAIVIAITDDSMMPYFHIGEYVGGVQVSNDKLDTYINEFCILELENNLILARMLQRGTHQQGNLYTASCMNPASKASPLNLIDVKVVSAAPIIWHRRKLSSY